MSTITAILEADADGTLHLPLPAELRHGKVKVVASVEAADPGEDGPRGRLVMGEFGRRVLVAPEGAPPMTSERIKAILEEETCSSPDLRRESRAALCPRTRRETSRPVPPQWPGAGN